MADERDGRTVPPPLSEPGPGRRASRAQLVGGVAWTGGSQFATALLGLATMAVLARLLTPADFGLLGTALVFTAFVRMVNEAGLGAALVQRAHIDDGHLATVFVLNLLLGLISFGIGWVGAPLVAVFFRDPAVEPVVRWVSLGFVLGSIGTIQKTVLTRRMDFGRLAGIEVLGVATYGVVAMSLAFAGYGVWSLVGAVLAQQLTESTVAWLVSDWRPRAVPSRRFLRDLIGFGVSVWAFNLVHYLRENIDFMMVGRLLGTSSLGIYTLAFNLANLPRRKLMSVVSRVSFPAFSRVQDDREAVASGHRTVLRYTAIIAFPALVGLAVVAPEFVPVVYGARWVDAVGPLQVLALAGALYCIASQAGSVFLALGRARLQLWIGIVCTGFLTTAVLVASPLGIVAVAVAVLVHAAVLLAGTHIGVARLLRLPRGWLIGVLGTGTAGSLVMGLVVWVVRSGLVTMGLASGAILSISVLLGLVVYPLILWLLGAPEVRALAGAALQLRTRASASLRSVLLTARRREG